MFPDNVVKALEHLIRVVRDSNGNVDKAISNAIDALGYDPAEQEFLVSLEIGVLATNPNDAVKEFKSLITESVDNWAYNVTDENGAETLINGWISNNLP